MNFYSSLAPLALRIDRMGSQARAALGELGAHVTETIQGLSELIAFQATARRRMEFMALARRYQQVRLALLDDLTRQSEGLELATGVPEGLQTRVGERYPQRRIGPYGTQRLDGRIARLS